VHWTNDINKTTWA